jgi:hypothetical protein
MDFARAMDAWRLASPAAANLPKLDRSMGKLDDAHRRLH